MLSSPIFRRTACDAPLSGPCPNLATPAIDGDPHRSTLAAVAADLKIETTTIGIPVDRCGVFDRERRETIEALRVLPCHVPVPEIVGDSIPIRPHDLPHRWDAQGGVSGDARFTFRSRERDEIYANSESYTRKCSARLPHVLPCVFVGWRRECPPISTDFI